MNKLQVCIFLAATLVLASCGGKNEKKSYDEIGESGLTTRTENLAANIRTGAGNGVIIGQLYGTLQGVGWECDSARSDFFSICGEGPAATGYELRGIEIGSKINSDSLSFDDIRADVLEMFWRGGLVTMTWSIPDKAKDPESLKKYTAAIAKYFDSLQNDYGIKAPVVLFPMPLDGKSWYASLPSEEYLNLFHQITTQLHDLDVTNVIFGYSTNGDLDRCPVDDIDVIELRDILANADSAQFEDRVLKTLPKVVSFAQEHMKAVGLTTGVEGCPSSEFFTQTMSAIVRNNRLAYVMFGRNYGDPKDGTFCVPYPGYGNEYISDFVMFHNEKSAIFIRHLNGLYLKKGEQNKK